MKFSQVPGTPSAFNIVEGIKPGDLAILVFEHSAGHMKQSLDSGDTNACCLLRQPPKPVGKPQMPIPKINLCKEGGLCSEKKKKSPLKIHNHSHITCVVKHSRKKP